MDECSLVLFEQRRANLFDTLFTNGRPPVSSALLGQYNPESQQRMSHSRSQSSRVLTRLPYKATTHRVSSLSPPVDYRELVIFINCQCGMPAVCVSPLPTLPSPTP
uniref:Uncharacterized protein n=1 Tax=Caenorhabditis tropicalis TaxID=1561998 RepID=A0A1I7TCY6_9PELO